VRDPFPPQPAQNAAAAQNAVVSSATPRTRGEYFSAFNGFP